MPINRGGRFRRTDMWREGKWLDLWSVVHVLSGTSMGLILYFLNLGATASVILTLTLLIAYEMWETIVRIEETHANRFMDVVVGMASFLPAFFLLAPAISGRLFMPVFGLLFTANIVMSVFGWRASQKASALEKRIRARYAAQRARLLERRERLRGKFPQ